MSIKEIIEIVNTYGVTVKYYDRERLRDIILHQYGATSPIYFQAIDDKERKKYEKSKSKKEFCSTSAAIYFPDISALELIDLFECDGGGIHQDTMKQIKPFLRNDIPDSVIYVIYLFLHEVGHWEQFKNMNNKVELFFNQDYELSKNNYEKMQKLWKRRDERLKKGSECELTFREKEELENLREEYRSIPKEKDADEFALKNMQFALNRYTISTNRNKKD